MADTIPGNISTNTYLGVGGSFQSEIDSAGDADWFTLYIGSGWGYHMRLRAAASDLGTLQNPLLRLYDHTGALIKEDNDSGVGLDSYMYYMPQESGTFFYLGAMASGTGTGSYTISVELDQLLGTGSQEEQFIDTMTEGSLGEQGDISDWRIVNLVAGTTYLFDMWGTNDYGPDRDLDDPWLMLRDTSGILLASDDNGGPGNTSRILYTATQTGTYYLDSRSGNNGAGDYRQMINSAPIEGTIEVGAPQMGHLTFPGDIDLFTVTLVAGETYTASLDGVTLFNPNLELLDASGAVLAENDNGGEGAGFFNSRLTFTATTSGTHYLAARASGFYSSGSYTLALAAGAPGDALEPNNTAATATDLGEVSGNVGRSNLSIGTGDVDLFRFTLANPGRVGDEISVGFLHAMGDIDIALYDANGANLLKHSASADDNETLSLEGLAAGTYLLQVYGYSGATNAAYSLGVHVSPYVPEADYLEDNDAMASATDLGIVEDSVMHYGLSAEANDADWFRFTLPSEGRAGDQVLVSFLHALGDVDVQLYAPGATGPMRSSSGVENHETIPLAGLAAGEYFIRVAGYLGAANPEYSIEVSVVSRIVTADRFEGNDEPTQATALGAVLGSRAETHLTAEANDADWFTFILTDTARAGDYVAANFSHRLGDVDIALFNASTYELVGVSQTGLDEERINLNGLGAGTYAVVVGALNGASNPDYTLTVNVQPPIISADRFENNDTAATATNFGTAGGVRSEANLTLQAGDDDWYKFTLGQHGRAGDSLVVNYNHLQGDIDLEIYDATGNNILFRSYGGTGVESIGISSLASGTYLARVFGYDGASNPRYSLTLTTPPPVTADRLEQNDTAATATDLRTIIGALSKYNLSIEANDPDWFRFTLPGTGQAGDAVSISFTHAQGDVDIELYAANGVTKLATSNGSGNSEEISLRGLAAGDYLLKVFGYNGATNPAYDLRLNAAPAVVAPDMWENNDTRTSAIDLRTLAGSRIVSSLTVESNDADWFKFTIANPGIAGEGVWAYFDGELGDVDMRLYNASGAEIRSSTGRGSQETINFDGLAAGTYYVNVYGSGNHSNPDYALRFNARPAAPPADYDEGNDSINQATSLRIINGTHTRTSLTMEPNEADWYQFSLGDVGRAGDNARIEFLNSQGDLDLSLYGPGGTLISQSTTTNNFEQLSLEGLFGTYYLKVEGYRGAQNTDYTLKVTGPSPIESDAWEYNDVIDLATPLRKLTNNITGATLTGGDKDYYEFSLAQMGGSGDKVTIRADRPGVEVRVLNPQGQAWDWATTDSSGVATISLKDYGTGHWIAEVSPTAEAPVARYDMDIKARGAATKAGWTVMVYIDGDNNLEGSALEDLQEMEAAAERDGVNVVVMLDRIGGFDTGYGDWTGTRGGYVSHDWFDWSMGSQLADWGERNMGNGSNLTNFINWAAEEAPADRYMLVVWDHGGAALQGVAMDDTSGGDGLSMKELRQAVENSNVGKFDIIGFDACLMATVEVAAELTGVAKYMVGSEKVEPGDGWDYKAILDYLRSDSSATGLAGKVVDSYNAWFKNEEHLSAIDLGDIAALKVAIDAFADLMRSPGTAERDWRSVTAAASRTKKADADFANFIDLRGFMQALKDSTPTAAIDNAAQAVIDALDTAVIHNGGVAGYNGLTVYFPGRTKTIDGAYTATNFQFLADTDWDLFLKTYKEVKLTAAAEGWEPDELDFAEWLTPSGRVAPGTNDMMETAYRLGTINQADFTVAGLSLDSTLDVDWYTFTLPTGEGFAPAVSVAIMGNVAGVLVRLLDADGTLVAEMTSTSAQPVLTFHQALAGGTYLLHVTAPGANELPRYEIHIDALGPTANPVALPDFAEGAGGNDSYEKAWSLGTAVDITRVGGMRNLSLDAADQAAGASGGDWFRVAATRQTEQNPNLVELADVTNNAASLRVAVYDSRGQQIAQGSAGELSVAFERQVDDVWVQVQSEEGAAVRGYTLHVLDDRTGPKVQAVSVASTTGQQGSTLDAGDTITFAVQFNEKVLVTGTPSLGLGIGVETVQAAYSGGAGTNTLLFTATIHTGHWDGNGISLAANSLSLAGGAIQDAAGTAATLTHAPLSDDPQYKVDARPHVPGQTFNGSAAANTVVGTANDDNIFALGGNDTVRSGTGFDNIDGGEGRDFSEYTGPRSSYIVTRLGDFNATVAGPEGTDSLTNVERLKFSDGYVALDLNGNAGMAYRLYQAAFDRVPDIGGLGYQMNDLDTIYSIEQVASNFIASPEFQSTYGPGLTNSEYVTLLYANVLDRAPDAGGLAYHIARIESGVGREVILIGFSESNENKGNVYAAIENGMFYTL